MLATALLHTHFIEEQNLKEKPLSGPCHSQSRRKREMAEPRRALRAFTQKCHMSLPHTYHCPKEVTIQSHTPMKQKLYYFTEPTLLEKGLYLLAEILSTKNFLKISQELSELPGICWLELEISSTK